MTEHRRSQDRLDEERLRRRLHAAVRIETPSDRLRTAVLDLAAAELGNMSDRRPRRRRRVVTTAIAALGVASIGIGAAAASGFLDRPDPGDAKAVEELPLEGERSAHTPDWRRELSAEQVQCSFGAPHDDLVTFASVSDLTQPLTISDVTSECVDSGRSLHDSPEEPLQVAAEPRLCAVPEPAGDPARAPSDDRFMAVVVDGRSCAEAGFSDTDADQLLAIVNDRRAREARFLARFSTGTCLTADEAMAIGQRHRGDLGDDFLVHFGRDDPGYTCFTPAVYWGSRQAELYPVYGPPGEVPPGD